MDSWLNDGIWPNPGQFLHRPRGPDLTETEGRLDPIAATYANGAAVLQFDASCPEFAPDHTPDYFEKLEYCRGTVDFEPPVIPDLRRTHEWRIEITARHHTNLHSKIQKLPDWSHAKTQRRGDAEMKSLTTGFSAPPRLRENLGRFR